MKKTGQVFAIFFLGNLCYSWGAISPDAILRKSDEIRNPQMDYAFSVKVTSVKPGQGDSVSTYDVLVKGREKTIVKTLTPEVDRGRILLMNGINLWGFLPNVSKPLRISLQERLVGEVANGDLARANFSGDYHTKLAGVKQKGKRKFYVLDLKAKSKEITYNRVILWVAQANFRPYKAEFYGASGRVLKYCSYENYGELGGKTRPRRLVMTDALKKGQYSTIDYSGMKIQTLPEKYFTKDYMKKLAD